MLAFDIAGKTLDSFVSIFPESTLNVYHCPSIQGALEGVGV